MYYKLQKTPLIVAAFCLDRQTGATLKAAALQNKATSLRSDAGTKAVRAGAVTGVRLVGSFWHILTILPYLPL